MASLNKVMLIGSLGRDPEIRYTASGQAVASISLATGEKFKNKSGEWEEPNASRGAVGSPRRDCW